jgi:hypothetical protein
MMQMRTSEREKQKRKKEYSIFNCEKFGLKGAEIECRKAILHEYSAKCTQKIYNKQKGSDK